MTEETAPQKDKTTGKFLRNVLLKGLLLFLILNFALAFIPHGNAAGKLSLYNILWPGRVRLPFGENPQEAYNLSLYDLEAMFASHEINAGAKPADEFRIILIGDSATWGTLLEPGDTLSGLINQAGLTAAPGKTVRAYNLAYPSMSIIKDLMLLEKALAYEPDLIVWPVTLQSFPRTIQVETPLVANNPQLVRPLIENLGLNLDPNDPQFVDSTFLDRTLIGRSRAIFDALQLQFYGLKWAATGIDQTYPADYTPAQRDFEAGDVTFQGWQEADFTPDKLALEVLNAGTILAGDVPVLVVNEPILISEGENSDIRYDFFYPRWTYDLYRQEMNRAAENADWTYVDLWDVVPQTEFTNSAVHLTPEGSLLFFETLMPALIEAIGSVVVK
ncbi:MAG: hypothetical protein H0S79_11095 [Anaerolineaceae bacterium]|nr:hypothetical protein [Anaerolineaceae bacterium]